MRDRGFAFWFMILVGLVTLALFAGGGFYIAQQQGAIDLSGAPDMVVTIAAEPTSVQTDGKLTYAVTHTNQGEASAGSVSLTINLPQNVTVDKITPSAACQRSDTIVTCRLGSRSGGATGSVTVESTVGAVASGTALAANVSVTVGTTRDLKRAEGDTTNNSASASATVQ